jgi:ankyrin repeat protein
MLVYLFICYNEINFEVIMFAYYTRESPYTENNTACSINQKIQARDINGIKAMMNDSNYVHFNLNLKPEAHRRHETFIHSCSNLATEENTLEMFQFLVANGLNLKHANKNQQDYQRDTPLHLAVLANYPKVVKYLIEQGAQIDGLNSNFCTPLHLATERNLDEITFLLIEAKAQINPIDSWRHTPLYHALTHNNYLVAKKLIECGADVHHLFGKWNNFLFEPEILKHSPMVELLISEGIDIFHQGEGGNILYLCAKTENAKMWEKFLSLGVNPFDPSNMEVDVFYSIKNTKLKEQFTIIYDKIEMEKKLGVSTHFSKTMKI